MKLAACRFGTFISFSLRSRFSTKESDDAGATILNGIIISAKRPKKESQKNGKRTTRRVEDVPMFLRNYWYVAATDTEISRKPLGRMILGDPIVLFRAEDGTPVAFEDRCPHRHRHQRVCLCQ